jgi:hypothetical protein
MSRRNVTILAALSLTAVIGVLICFAFFAPDSMVYSREIKLGNEVVRSIDALREREGKLPASLSEVGIPVSDQDHYFYQPCTDGRYIVWFGTRLGESMTYDSATRHWDPFNGCNAAKVIP